MSLTQSLIKKLFYKVYSIILAISPNFHNKLFYRKISGLSLQNFKNKKTDESLLLLDIFLNKNDIFIDIGANIGEYIYKASKHISPIQIFAYEPLPGLYKRLKKVFPEVNMYDVALSDVESKSAFKIPVIDKQKILTRSTLNTNFVETGEEKNVIIEVKTDTLDNQVEKFSINKIALIKIDVEGHEWKVIKGAKKTLQKYKPIIIIEIEQRHHSFPIQQIIEDVLKLNYKCYYFNSSNIQLLPVENAEQLQNMEHFKTLKYINNFVFICNTIPIAQFNEVLKRATC